MKHLEAALEDALHCWLTSLTPESAIHFAKILWHYPSVRYHQITLYHTGTHFQEICGKAKAPDF